MDDSILGKIQLVHRNQVFGVIVRDGIEGSQFSLQDFFIQGAEGNLDISQKGAFRNDKVDLLFLDVNANIKVSHLRSKCS
ncbi:hypothetical protein [Acidaminococcus timonensis]|uniref:hypothetical protein n=1 Tax=Acidaminococcus timonensis TaxID=1871002 RepID=UPI0026EF47C8|nr:hypothetical protein [Acidaminococcus timonensis]